MQLRVEILDEGPATAAGEGSGRGLVGMRERASLVGGRLEAGPRLGGGLRGPGMAAAATPGRERRTEPGSRRDRGHSRLRVLIADDQALVRAGFRMILEAQPDIEVVAEAADGEAAVRLTRRHRPDVVLMDVRMPGLDGLEATRRLLGPAGVTGASRRTAADRDSRRSTSTSTSIAALQAGRRRVPAQGRLARASGRLPCGRSRSAMRCSRRRSRAASSSASRDRLSRPLSHPRPSGG